MPSCLFCKTKRAPRNILEKAEARIEKELDIVNFIRKQIKLKVILEKIFNKEERKQIRKNKRFRLTQDVSEDSFGHEAD